jgi:hypothetical protein
LQVKKRGVANKAERVASEKEKVASKTALSARKNQIPIQKCVTLITDNSNKSIINIKNTTKL